MNDKINRGQLVRTYIGEGLAPFKFEYKGYQGDSWKFERNMKGAVQTISIYPYRFDQSMITFELYTNVKNSEYASKIGTNVVSASMLDGIVSNGQIRGYWQYGNEQELIQVLGEMKGTEILRIPLVTQKLVMATADHLQCPQCRQKSVEPSKHLNHE